MGCSPSWEQRQTQDGAQFEGVGHRGSEGRVKVSLPSSYFSGSILIDTVGGEFP